MGCAVAVAGSGDEVSKGWIVANAVGWMVWVRVGVLFDVVVFTNVVSVGIM